jgi:carboxylesterase type B
MGQSTMAQRLLTTFTLLTSLSGVTATSNTSTVTLPGYGTFLGTTVSQTLTKKSLPRPVDAWLGIDYASQPIGDGRFAPVGAPTPFSGVKNATSYGYSCFQDPLELTYEMDEACLSMNVFRPQGLEEQGELPVLIWIHGVSLLPFWTCCGLLIVQGGFVAGSARSFDGASFVANSREPLIVVTFNYRVSSHNCEHE